MQSIQFSLQKTKIIQKDDIYVYQQNWIHLVGKARESKTGILNKFRWQYGISIRNRILSKD